MIKNNLKQAKCKQVKNYDIEKSIVSLKQILQEIQIFLKNVQNIIQDVEQCKLQNTSINNYENQLLNVQKYGFNQMDDYTINNLTNISEQEQDLDIYKQLQDQSNLIIKKALNMKEWRLQDMNNEKSLSQKIQDAQYQIQQIDDVFDKNIYTGAISNNLKYIVSGGEDYQLKKWDYQTNQLIKSIKLNYEAYSCKFTEDSTLLYAGSYKYIYQFDVNNKFIQLSKNEIHQNFIYNLYCISNSIILTSSLDKYIIKTDVSKNQSLFKIYAHNSYIYGLDYNKSNNLIASGSNDQSIKLWNGTNGSLFLEKLRAHYYQISQLLFIINNNQLLSLDVNFNLIIWNVHNQKKYLEALQLIEDFGHNISLILKEQQIITTGQKFIKIYSIKGEAVRKFHHEIDDFYFFNTIQPDSMKAVLIQGKFKLQVIQFDMN